MTVTEYNLEQYTGTHAAISMIHGGMNGVSWITNGADTRITQCKMADNYGISDYHMSASMFRFLRGLSEYMLGTRTM